MTEKRYSHDGVVIVDHLKKDLIYIDGKDELLELAEYVDRLQEENLKLKSFIKQKQWTGEMTEKRLIIRDGDYAWIDTTTGYVVEVEDAFDLINQLHEENEKLKSKNRGLQSELQIFKEDVTHSNLQINKLADENDELKHECNYLQDRLDDFINVQNENEQLKKRNENQYNQLTELWQIIEEENWEKLIAMKKQLKEDEERLQQEWKCYE